MVQSTLLLYILGFPDGSIFCSSEAAPLSPTLLFPTYISTLHLSHPYTGAVVVQRITSLPRMASRDPSLLKLGMMISQTRVSDAGLDVKN